VEGSCEHGDEPSGSLKLLEIFWLAAQIAASQEGLSSVCKTEYHTWLRLYEPKRVQRVHQFFFYGNICVNYCLLTSYLQSRHIPQSDQKVMQPNADIQSLSRPTESTLHDSKTNMHEVAKCFTWQMNINVQCLLLFTLYGYHCMCNWLTNAYQHSLCFYSQNIIEKFIRHPHLQHWIEMIYTLEQWICCMIHMSKTNCINCTEDDFAINILVFKFQLPQQFSNWWTKCIQLGLS
jgi:hypothetical protein